MEEDDGEGFFAAAASNPALRGTEQAAGGNGEGGEKAVSGTLFAFIGCVCGWSQVCIISPTGAKKPLTKHIRQSPTHTINQPKTHGNNPTTNQPQTQGWSRSSSWCTSS